MNSKLIKKSDAITLYCKACSELDKNWIVVFGSNLAAKHGKGGALHAFKYHGASKEVSFGLAGSSFAIPTKDQYLGVLPLDQIREYVEIFIQFADRNKDLNFFVTRIGCGLSNYNDIDIAPLFTNASDNCCLPENWKI